MAQIYGHLDTNLVGNTPLAHGERRLFWNVKNPSASRESNFWCVGQSKIDVRHSKIDSTKSSNVSKCSMTLKHNEMKGEVTFYKTIACH